MDLSVAIILMHYIFYIKACAEILHWSFHYISAWSTTFPTYRSVFCIRPSFTYGQEAVLFYIQASVERNYFLLDLSLPIAMKHYFFYIQTSEQLTVAAAASKLSSAMIFKLLAAINALASSTFVPGKRWLNHKTLSHSHTIPKVKLRVYIYMAIELIWFWHSL